MASSHFSTEPTELSSLMNESITTNTALKARKSRHSKRSAGSPTQSAKPNRAKRENRLVQAIPEPPGSVQRQNGEFKRFKEICEINYIKSRKADPGFTEEQKNFLFLANELSPSIAYEFDKAAETMRELYRIAIFEHDSADLSPLVDIKRFTDEFMAKWCTQMPKWQAKIEEGRLSATDVVLFKYYTASMPKIRSHQENIEIMLDSPSADPDIQGWIKGITTDTLWGWDKLFRAWDKYLAKLEEAQMQRDREVASAVALEASEGLRRRKNAANSVCTFPNQDETDLSTKVELGDETTNSTTPKPIKDTAAVPALGSWQGISFPPFFYPTARPTISRLKILLLDRNTLLLLIFFLALTSGIFSGMAFFNPTSQIYSSLSQLFRLLASLWCLLIPLLRDKALPIWPARGWLYSAVGISAGLGVIGVIIVRFNTSWSGLIAALGDFAALGATVLLAMGINGGSSIGGHSAIP